MVNRAGRRFTNEAANYNAFGAAFHMEDVSRFEYANLPCWLVFDQNYVDTYGFRVAAGGVGGQPPSWVPVGQTPAELADCGLADPALASVCCDDVGNQSRRKRPDLLVEAEALRCERGA